MTQPPARRDRPKLRAPKSTAYEVGYAKPPTDHRFKKGQSGNPRGRPKGAKNRMPALNEERLKSIILAEAYRSVRVNDGDRQVSVPMAQAVVRSLAVAAVKGQQRAQRLFTELLRNTESENRKLHDDWMDVAITYKIEWERELDRRRQFGITGLPAPLPHPDHVVIDMRNGTANIRGPATKEEKAEWDLWVGRKHDFEGELKELEALRGDPEYSQRVILEEIERTKKVLEIISRAVG